MLPLLSSSALQVLCGFDVDTDIDIDDLKDSECTITVKKVENTINGKEYFRVTKAVPLFVQA